MSDLRELYQELILDHSRRPRNFGSLESATHHGHGQNPLCGDDIRLHLEIQGDKIVAAAFEGSGCAICTSSSSLLTEATRGLTTDQAAELFRAVQAMVTGQGEAEILERFPKLKVFSGVREFPVRVKCAALAWRTLEHILVGRSDAAKTEGDL